MAWESRKNKFPSVDWLADFLVALEQVFGCKPTLEVVEEVYPLLVNMWRDGATLREVARSICACENSKIVPSKGAREQIRRGVMAAPAGAKRGTPFGWDSLRLRGKRGEKPKEKGTNHRKTEVAKAPAKPAPEPETKPEKTEAPATAQKPRARKTSKVDSGATADMFPFSVALVARPNPDFEAAKHQGSVNIPVQWRAVPTLGVALDTTQTFIRENSLGAGNYLGEAGLVLRGGKPFARIAFNGSIFQLDEAGKETGQHLDRDGKIVKIDAPAPGTTQAEPPKPAKPGRKGRTKKPEPIVPDDLAADFLNAVARKS